MTAKRGGNADQDRVWLAETLGTRSRLEASHSHHTDVGITNPVYVRMPGIERRRFLRIDVEAKYGEAAGTGSASERQADIAQAYDPHSGLSRAKLTQEVMSLSGRIVGA